MNPRRAQRSATILATLVVASVGVLVVRRAGALHPESAGALGSQMPAAISRPRVAATPATGRSPTLTDRVRRRLADWKAEVDPLRRQAIHDELLALLSADHVAEIVRALSPDLLDTPFGEIALTRWAAMGRRAAAEWMAGISGATEYQAGLVVYGWLKEDRAGLHTYLETLPNDSAWKQSVLKTATNDALLLKDGVEAVGLLLRLPPQPQRDEMLGWATTEWAMHDPEHAAEWTQQVSDPALQSKLFGAAIVGYAWNNPQRAAELLVNAAGSNPVDTTALTGVMNIWSREDPSGAARWAAQSLTDVWQVLAIRSALTAWGYRDFSAAEAWVKNLSEGALRAQADRTLRKVEAALRGAELSDDLARGGG